MEASLALRSRGRSRGADGSVAEDSVLVRVGRVVGQTMTTTIPATEGRARVTVPGMGFGRDFEVAYLTPTAEVEPALPADLPPPAAPEAVGQVVLWGGSSAIIQINSRRENTAVEVFRNGRFVRRVGNYPTIEVQMEPGENRFEVEAVDAWGRRSPRAEVLA